MEVSSLLSLPTSPTGASARQLQKPHITAVTPDGQRAIRNENNEYCHFVRQQRAFDDVQLTLNTLDNAERGEAGLYLSLTGTSAEDADSGQVGRGNRVSGVIAFHRPAGAEAAAGKNPVSHVGKIYNVLAHHLAQEIIAEVSEVEAVSLWIVSQIGQPIDALALVQAVIRPREGEVSSPARNTLEALIHADERDESGIGLLLHCSATTSGPYPFPRANVANRAIRQVQWCSGFFSLLLILTPFSSRG